MTTCVVDPVPRCTVLRTAAQRMASKVTQSQNTRCRREDEVRETSIKVSESLTKSGDTGITDMFIGMKTNSHWINPAHV